MPSTNANERNLPSSRLIAYSNDRVNSANSTTEPDTSASTNRSGLVACRARKAGSTGTPPYWSERRSVRRTSSRPRLRRRRLEATLAASLRASGLTAWRSSSSWVVEAPRKSTSSSWRSRYSSAAPSAPVWAASRWRTRSASMRRNSSRRRSSRSRSRRASSRSAPVPWAVSRSAMAIWMSRYSSSCRRIRYMK